ncbi:MAG: hypothetical protein E7451_05595 [Ruminococcaceae bacterium]|nr:hypothetical protein [Oscillospiraceae bacterium]
MKEGKARVSWRAVLLGLGVAMVTVTAVTAIGAGLMARGSLGVEWMDCWSAGILVVSGLLGGLAAMLGGGSAVDAALTAVGELVVLMGLNGVLCGGRMEGFAVTALALAGGCGAAMLLRLNRRSGRKRRRRR